MSRSVDALRELMGEVRRAVARPDNHFMWSSWDDTQEALEELDKLIALIDSKDEPPWVNIQVLFLPTGALQEVAISSGWGNDFLVLADRFDAAFDAWRAERK